MTTTLTPSNKFNCTFVARFFHDELEMTATVEVGLIPASLIPGTHDRMDPVDWADSFVVGRCWAGSEPAGLAQLQEGLGRTGFTDEVMRAMWAAHPYDMAEVVLAMGTPRATEEALKGLRDHTSPNQLPPR